MSSSPETFYSEVLPILDDDVAAAGHFLYDNMNKRFSPEQWRKGLVASWLEDAPNHGFMIKHKEQVVGVICALYSKQIIGDQEELFCNPHSWCVLGEHRKKSIELILAVIRQEKYHFTMFSPNKSGMEIFSYLRFEPIDSSYVIAPNIPSISFSGGVRHVRDRGEILDSLATHTRQYFVDHEPYSWIEQMVFEKDGDACLVILKHSRYKRLPCANILYISDIDFFSSHWRAIRKHLFFHHGFFSSRIESRYIKTHLRFSLCNIPGHPKYYLSSSLNANNIDNIYSELIALDI